MADQFHNGYGFCGQGVADLSLDDLVCVGALVKLPDLAAKGIFEHCAPCVMEHSCTAQGCVCRWLQGGHTTLGMTA